VAVCKGRVARLTKHDLATAWHTCHPIPSPMTSRIAFPLVSPFSACLPPCARTTAHETAQASGIRSDPFSQTHSVRPIAAVDACNLRPLCSPRLCSPRLCSPRLHYRLLTLCPAPIDSSPQLCMDICIYAWVDTARAPGCLARHRRGPALDALCCAGSCCVRTRQTRAHADRGG